MVLEKSMKLIWTSDIHLNFLNKNSRQEFYEQLREADGDSILITGDIAESHNIEQMLSEMQECTGKPVHFVLGNHDYYGSSISHMRKQMKKYRCATYLPKRFGYKLSDTTWLTGVDGWGDCRNGDPYSELLRMADWLYIEELRENSKMGQTPPVETLQKLADDDAARLARNVLRCIQKGAERVIIASHVPPFEEACLHAGRKSTPSGLPFFSSKILGFTLKLIADQYPNVDFLWLSGHTHSRAVYKPCNNMTVRVAKAEYYYPQIEESIPV